MNLSPERIAQGGSESDHQKAFFAYAAMMGQQDHRWRMIFAVPNGGKRGIVTATRLKAEGVRAGVPDIFVAVPCMSSHGLFGEFKVGSNKPSTAQIVWINNLTNQGYTVKVWYSWKEAADSVSRYFRTGE